MTKTEAQIIADIIKAGKRYKSGHYQFGYIYLWYEKSEKCFKYKNEDMALDYMNPSITVTNLTEEQFIKKMIKDYDYNKMVRELY